MSDLRKAAEAALEALEYENDFHKHRKESPYGSTTDAMKALRAALAQPEQDLQLVANLLKEYGLEAMEVIAALKTQPEQEAVAWRYDEATYRPGDLRGRQWRFNLFAMCKPYLHPIQEDMVQNVTPLYTHPPQRKPLTDDEIELAYREIWRDLSDGFSHTSVEWIEAGIRYAEKVHGIANEP